MIKCPNCDNSIMFETDELETVCSNCKLTIYSCPGCLTPIHPGRVKIGYKTCINCSTTKRYGFIHVFGGKTGNTIEIVKDPEVAEKIRKLQSRRHGQI